MHKLPKWGVNSRDISKFFHYIKVSLLCPDCLTICKTACLLDFPVLSQLSRLFYELIAEGNFSNGLNQAVRWGNSMMSAPLVSLSK